MKNKKETRTCVGCRKKDNKYNLIRFVNKTQTEIDIENKKQGRGFYICRNEVCLIRAMKNKSLKIDIDKEKFEKLRGVILGREQ